MERHRHRPDPDGNRQPQRHGQRQRRQQPHRRTNHRQPLREILQQSRKHVGKASGQQMLNLVRPAANRRWILRREKHETQDHGGSCAYGKPAQSHRAIQRISRSDVLTKEQHVRRKKHHHRGAIQQSFHHDRGERGRSAQSLLAGQQIRRCWRQSQSSWCEKLSESACDRSAPAGTATATP